MPRPDRKKSSSSLIRQAAYYLELKVEPDRPGKREVEELHGRLPVARWGATYGEFLKTDEWKETARRHKGQYPSCWVCRGTSQLQVHHLTYERVTREQASDLVTLCCIHHRQVHFLSALNGYDARSFAWILAEIKADRWAAPKRS